MKDSNAEAISIYNSFNETEAQERCQYSKNKIWKSL